MLRRFLVSIVTLAALTMTLSATAARASDTLPAKSGFRTSITMAATNLVLPERTAAGLADAGVPLESNGNGAELDLGWAFSPRFSLDLKMLVSNADDGDEPLSPVVAQFLLEGTTRLRPGSRVDPYLSGGVGGVGVGFGKEPTEEQTLEASVISLGAGVDVRLSSRWAMTFGYRGSSMDFDRQTVMVPGRTTAIDVAGDAVMHQLRFGCDFRL